MLLETRHTQPPCVDITAIIPELAPLAREAVRLHPRRGEVPADGSKIGGRFLWPSEEAWPHCGEHHCPLVTILQLHRDDVPELGFPKQADLFQLLWCPNSHELTYQGPFPQVFWRTAADVKTALSSHPLPTLTDAVGSATPTPCQLFPERVIEYPSDFDLCDNHPNLWALVQNSSLLQAKASELDPTVFEDAGTLYGWDLSVADGTKVGGYVNWCQSPQVPICTCGALMEHLLTIADAEFDGGTRYRWLTQEEQSVWGSSPDERFQVQSAAGFTHGGRFFLFICRKCASWPVQAVFQC